MKQGTMTHGKLQSKAFNRPECSSPKLGSKTKALQPPRMEVLETLLKGAGFNKNPLKSYGSPRLTLVTSPITY